MSKACRRDLSVLEGAGGTRFGFVAIARFSVSPVAHDGQDVFVGTFAVVFPRTPVLQVIGFTGI